MLSRVHSSVQAHLDNLAHLEFVSGTSMCPSVIMHAVHREALGRPASSRPLAAGDDGMLMHSRVQLVGGPTYEGRAVLLWMCSCAGVSACVRAAKRVCVSVCVHGCVCVYGRGGCGACMAV